TVAVRVPAHPVALRLIEETGGPIAAPSANRFGRVSPTRAEDVLDDLAGRIDLVLDGGQTSIGVESSVVLAEGEKLFLLRPGGVSLEDLEAAAGPFGDQRSGGGAILSPGTLERHYAPRVPLFMFEGNPADLALSDLDGIAVIALTDDRKGAPEVIALSREGDLREAAANLFRVLRGLESRKIRRALVLPLEERGLGRAIMDRLRRGASGTVKCLGNKLIYIDKVTH
ncbi:MAG TPA: Sua5 family C-terminal domain-containing protein, partial [Atribacteraceae bacterium]|nr:Sua5 family C-terminal domain-containing protein [Atribacteraceae bacterium]